MSPFRGRRRCLAFIPAAMSAAMLGGWTSSVSASPGFLGKYDFAHPMFLQGTVVGIEPTLPRPTLTILSPLNRSGQLVLTLDWRLSRAVLDEPELLKAGDPVSAVVYFRSARDEYHGELLVVLLRTPDEQVLVSSRPPVPRP